MSDGQTIIDLAMLVRRLVVKLEKECPGTDIAVQALDYLKRKDLWGSMLREDTTIPEPAQGERVAVCPTLDRECGEYYGSWCATCPKARTKAQGERQPGICPTCNERRLVYGHCKGCGHVCVINA